MIKPLCNGDAIVWAQMRLNHQEYEVIFGSLKENRYKGQHQGPSARQHTRKAETESVGNRQEDIIHHLRKAVRQL